jgi:hypothetical protein
MVPSQLSGRPGGDPTANKALTRVTLPGRLLSVPARLTRHDDLHCARETKTGGDC